MGLPGRKIWKLQAACGREKQEDQRPWERWVNRPSGRMWRWATNTTKPERGTFIPSWQIPMLRLTLWECILGRQPSLEETWENELRSNQGQLVQKSFVLNLVNYSKPGLAGRKKDPFPPLPVKAVCYDPRYSKHSHFTSMKGHAAVSKCNPGTMVFPKLSQGVHQINNIFIIILRHYFHVHSFRNI